MSIGVETVAQVITTVIMVGGGFWGVYTKLSDKMGNNREEILKEAKRTSEAIGSVEKNTITAIGKVENEMGNIQTSFKDFTQICEAHRTHFTDRISRLEGVHNDRATHTVKKRK